MLAVIGSIQTRSWDGQDGKKQYATEVSVDEAYFTGSKAESETTQGSGGYSAPANPAMQQPPVENGFDDMGFSPMDESEDDLPF